jgi:HD domain
MSLELVALAQIVATGAHQGQVRKYTGEAYISHPARVVGILQQYTQAPEILAAAWLHDVIEDCDVTLDAIEERFGSYVGALVWELTKPNAPSSRISMLIKAADLIDNLGTIAEVAPLEEARAYLAKKAPQVLQISEGIGQLKPELAEALAQTFWRNWSAVTE